MPPAMPIGTPIRLAIASKMPDPRMEFAIPPPTSHTGFGTWVKKARLRELAPLKRRYAKIAISGAMTRIVLPTAATVARWFMKTRKYRFDARARRGGGMAVVEAIAKYL